MARRNEKRALGSRTRWVLLGLALWVAVIVIGAGGDGSDAYLGVSGLGAVWLIMMVLLALLGLALLIWLNPFSNEFVPPDKPRGWVAIAVTIAIIAILFWNPDLLTGLFDDTAEQEEAQEGTVVQRGNGQADEEEAPEVVVEALDVLLLVTVIGAAGGVFYVTRRRGETHEVTPSSDQANEFEADLAVAVDRITTELLGGSDPRIAVLNAYAVLETTLATHGATRRQSETPTEYAQRSLQRLRVNPGPLVQLVQLYEVARFSEQAITSEQQQAAASALESVRQELQGIA